VDKHMSRGQAHVPLKFWGCYLSHSTPYNSTVSILHTPAINYGH
jgi:hypothetical protein